MSMQAVPETMSESDELEQLPVSEGQETDGEPLIVEFRKDDPSNPLNWSRERKWLITTIVTLSVFAITFTSSAYAESSDEIIGQFQISTELFIVGVSLFVLGFAIGPAVWGPLVRDQSF